MKRGREREEMKEEERSMVERALEGKLYDCVKFSISALLLHMYTSTFVFVVLSSITHSFFLSVAAFLYDQPSEREQNKQLEGKNSLWLATCLQS